MSKKGLIITTSILAVLLVIATILFGAVFCLRRQYITPLNTETFTFIDNDRVTQTISTQQIIDATGFKKGNPIFTLDKAKAKANIEEAFPSLKVVNIKTKSVISVEIVVKQRKAVYYADAHFAGEEVGYYLLDEDLVVIDNTTNSEDIKNCTKITIDGLSINSINIVRYTHLTEEWIQNITDELLDAVCDTVKITKQDDTVIVDTNGEYVNEEDFSKLVNSVKLVKAKAPAGIDTELKNRIEKMYWLVISYNDYTIKILRPEDNLKTKINACYNAISSLSEDNKTIICAYNEDGSIKLTQDI